MSIKKKSKKIGIGVSGGIVVLIGIVLIPYPGPGWLVVFAGLGILSTEFDWAKRTLTFAKGKYDAWQNWVKSQPPAISLLLGIATLAVVLVTIWLFNGYGVINNLFNLNQGWLQSPLPIFK